MTTSQLATHSVPAAATWTEPRLKLFDAAQIQQPTTESTIAAASAQQVDTVDGRTTTQASLTPLRLRRMWAALRTEEQKAIEQLAKRHVLPYRLNELLSTSPLRPPDWRWQGAVHWIDAGLPDWPKRLLKPLSESVRLLMAIAPNWAEPPPKLGLDPLLASTCAYLAAPNSAALRVSLDSLVLAGVPADEIASELGLPRHVVHWYEYLWFDVRSRLTATSMVVHEFIGAMQANEPATVAIARERRRLAYFGGPWVARELNRPVVDLPRPQTPGEAQSFLTADAAREIRLRGHLLFRTLSPDNPQHAKMILKLWRQTQIAEARERARSEHAQLSRWDSGGDLRPSEVSQAISIFKSYFRTPSPFLPTEAAQASHGATQ